MTRIATTAGLLLALGLLAPPPAVADEAWTWPLRGPVITAFHVAAEPYTPGQHRGIDIAGPLGAPVLAAAGGRVRFAGLVGNAGLTVSVRTADGRYDTSYLHLSSITVRAGQSLARGARVGTVGTTGRRSAVRPHLHFGVRLAGRPRAYRDPLDFLPTPPARRPAPTPRGAPLPRADPVRARPGRALRPVPAPVPLPVPARVAAPQHHGGRDVGLLLGCLGLLLASGLLGFWPGGDPANGKRGRPARSVWRPVVSRLASLLRI